MLPLDCCRVLISIHASALFFNASVFFNEKVRAREREIESEWVKRKDEKAAKTNQMMILRTKERKQSKGVWADEQNVHWPSIFNVEARELERQWRPLLMLLLLENLVSSLIDKREQNRKKKKKWSAVVLMHRGLQFEAGDSSAADASGCCCCLSDGVRCTNTDTDHLRFALLSLAAVHRKVRWGTWHYILVCACGSRRRVFVFLAPSAAAAERRHHRHRRLVLVALAPDGATDAVKIFSSKWKSSFFLLLIWWWWWRRWREI